jgi:acyl-CoA thioesterase
MSDTVTLADIIQNLADRGGNAVTVPEGWGQGRALYGGLVGALVAESMVRQLESPRPLRSLMGNFVAPAPSGEVKLEASVLRSGRAVVQTRGDLVSGDGQVCFAATAAFGDNRPGLMVSATIPFRARPRDSVPPVSSTQRALPGFLRHFETHWTGGGVPMSGSGDRDTGMWVRHRCDMNAFPIAKIVAIADLPPPIIMSHYTDRVMTSSLSWSLEFIVPPESIQTDWFYLDFTLEAAANGYSQQSGAIFDEAGTLLALSRQCMVYFE